MPAGNQYGAQVTVLPVNLPALAADILPAPPGLAVGGVAYIPGGEAAVTAYAEVEVALSRPTRRGG